MATGIRVALTAVLASGCLAPEADQLGEITSAVSVESYVTDSCSTAVVLGLSKQIGDEIGCMDPSALVRFAPGGNLTFSSNAVLPYLSAPAKAALAQVTQTTAIQLNSGFRTVAQQYLLYSWYQQGRCGIAVAASPGRSNHQSGRALDIADASAKRTAMANQGWSQLAGDPVHFDYLAAPDLRGQDVLAFQRLWNRNHPADTIAEDGVYGPTTEARLRQAPATGFEIGATCGNPAPGSGLGAEVLSIDGPDRVAPGAHAAYAILVENLSSADWPASTRIVVRGGVSSMLYDPATWRSPSEVGPIGYAIGAGQLALVGIEIVAPQVTTQTSIFTELVLTDGTTELGSIPLAVMITPDGDDGSAAESEEEHDHTGEGGGSGGGASIEVSGGCSAGGGLGWAMLALPALVMTRRRRR